VPVAKGQDKLNGLVNAGKLTGSPFVVTIPYPNLGRFGKAGDVDDLFFHICPFFKGDYRFVLSRHSG
jgi:hypothetical protein